MTGRSRRVRWVAGTTAVCLLMLVGSWLLAVGPVLDRAAATRAQAREVTAQNAVLQAQVSELRAQFADIDTYRAQLAGLRLELPDGARLTELTRQIDAAASAAGVTVVSVDVEAALDLADPQAAGVSGAAAPVDPAAVADDGGPAGGGTASTGSPSQAAPVQPPVDGLVAIPLTVGVVGPVDPVRSFLGTIQTGLERRLLVTTLTIDAVPASEGDDRLPPTASGDIHATIGAFAYVLLDEDAAAPEAEVPVPVPPTSGRAPFTPADDPAADEASAQAAAEAVAVATAEAEAQAEAAAKAEAAEATAAAQAAAEQATAAAEAATAAQAAAAARAVAPPEPAPPVGSPAG